MMNVGNVRIELTHHNAVRITQDTRHPEVLDCLLTFNEARILGQLLVSLKPPATQDNDLL